jgi:hypothetical protein
MHVSHHSLPRITYYLVYIIYIAFLASTVVLCAWANFTFLRLLIFIHAGSNKVSVHVF